MGLLYLAICAFVLATNERPELAVAPTPAPQPPRATSSAAQWFAEMKPFCNSVEVEVRHRFTPPPATSDGAGYSAACFALAGKIDQARAVIARAMWLTSRARK